MHSDLYHSHHTQACLVNTHKKKTKCSLDQSTCVSTWSNSIGKSCSTQMLRSSLTYQHLPLLQNLTNNDYLYVYNTFGISLLHFLIKKPECDEILNMAVYMSTLQPKYCQYSGKTGIWHACKHSHCVIKWDKSKGLNTQGKDFASTKNTNFQSQEKTIPIRDCVDAWSSWPSPPHLAEGWALLLLLRYVLGHPLLSAAELVIPPDLKELHLLFALIPFALQPPELTQEPESQIGQNIQKYTELKLRNRYYAWKNATLINNRGINMGSSVVKNTMYSQWYDW